MVCGGGVVGCGGVWRYVVWFGVLVYSVGLECWFRVLVWSVGLEC